MGDIEFNTSINGHEQIPDAIQDGVENALKETGAWLQRNGREEARDVIRGADRIWRRKLYYGWNTADGSITGPGEWEGTLENEAPHAEVVEDGLNPGNSPSVQDIIPWVNDKLQPHDLGKRDPTNWDPALQELANDYGPGYVLTAFAVKEKLEQRGYPGIGFMEAAERYMQRVGPLVLQRKAEKHLERELRKHGLK